MANTIESGHSKNVAGLDHLVSFTIGYGIAYNPTKKSIKIESLQSIAANAKNAINVVNTAFPAYSNAVAAREVAFLPLSKLATRVKNAIIATDTSDQVDDHARTYIRKIQGKRATPKKTEEEKKILESEGKEVRESSSSQMSFDGRLASFDQLIKLLSTIELYAPNEADLKVESLTALYNDLTEKNTAVLTSRTPLSNARISRNEILYKPNTGLVDTASDAKAYIKSLFGASSPQYKQVSNIPFRSVKV